MHWYEKLAGFQRIADVPWRHVYIWTPSCFQENCGSREVFTCLKVKYCSDQLAAFRRIAWVFFKEMSWSEQLAGFNRVAHLSYARYWFEHLAAFQRVVDSSLKKRLYRSTWLPNCHEENWLLFLTKCLIWARELPTSLKEMYWAAGCLYDNCLLCLRKYVYVSS